MSTRAGRYVRHRGGYYAFIPEPLPPEPPLRWDGDLLLALSQADRAVGRLGGLSGSLPNPELFVAMYVRREALYSSQIEGLQSSLDDMLAYEVGASVAAAGDDLAATINHVQAMNLGMELLRDTSVGGSMIKAVHGELLAGVRGHDRHPGEFRRTQNWVGPEGGGLENAVFVPPPPEHLPEAIGDFEEFLQDRTLPPLVTAGLAHAQFETIHPFGDGNGRVGRLLITLLLVERGVLPQPLLYPSLYLKQNRQEYYERLNATRHRGDWEGWLRFFLHGVKIAADDAARTAVELSALRDTHLRLAVTEHLGRYGAPLLDLLAEQPYVTIKYATEHLGTTPATAARLLVRLTELDVVTETTGQRRHRVYSYSSFLNVLAGDEDPLLLPLPPPPTQTSRSLSKMWVRGVAGSP